MTAPVDGAMPSGTRAGTPQVLLGHHLKQLKLPTILREYDKVARGAVEGARQGVSATVQLHHQPGHDPAHCRAR